MKIVSVRRISQVFFLLLFLWLCLASSPGIQWWQLRGWPVNWFLQLDPLVALGVLLTEQTLYAGLLWAVVTVVLTILLGRFFCGWVCPFGTIHQFFGFLGKRGKPLSSLAASNQYRRGQNIKYYLLVVLLSAAAGALLARLIRGLCGNAVAATVLASASVGVAALALFKILGNRRRAVAILLLLVGIWAILGYFLAVDQMLAASLQTGLLDPIPLLQRSVNLTLLPLFDASSKKLFAAQRYYEGAWLIATVFLLAVFLNFKTPRFYCRYCCPLGALFGVLGRFALWRIGKTHQECTQCTLCESNCEGGCEPAGQIHIPECVLCMNCFNECKHDLIGFRTAPSATGEIVSPELSRRGFMISFVSGIAAIPALRLGGSLAGNWNPGLVRPPGALAEERFLRRCIKCGQCMRVCPTNIIQPAGFEAGLEGLWTPVLNFRVGTSGCQLNCVSCGQVCPTAAIRPITLEQKLGRGVHAGAGPIRLGTAFVDYGRCLPWAMDKPCIVCQENCPVSPKAIFVREHYSSVRGGVFSARQIDSLTVEVTGTTLRPGQFATGDYYVLPAGGTQGERRLITANSEHSLKVTEQRPWEIPLAPGVNFEIQVRLQRPQVDPERCIGCGVCEHECPVSGKRAIRVTAENESRSRKHALLS